MIQSLANSLVLDSTQTGKSLLNSRKSNGPNTVPCGTPLMTGTLSDVDPSTFTCWFLGDRNDRIHWNVVP